MMDKEDHAALHAAGWNKEWGKFWENVNNRNPTIDEIKAQVAKMWEDDRFSPYLADAKRATRRYPWESIRRGAGELAKKAKKAGKGAKRVGKLLGIFAGIVASGQLANAATCGCQNEAQDLEDTLRLLVNNPNVDKCQAAMLAIHDYLTCAGVDEIPAALQLRDGIINTCTLFPSNSR